MIFKRYINRKDAESQRKYLRVFASLRLRGEKMVL